METLMIHWPTYTGKTKLSNVWMRSVAVAINHNTKSIIDTNQPLINNWQLSFLKNCTVYISQPSLLTQLTAMKYCWWIVVVSTISVFAPSPGLQSSRCGKPGFPSHGNISFSSLETVQYDCDRGFKLIGNKTRRCSGGKWTGHVPLCSKYFISSGSNCNFTLCRT